MAQSASWGISLEQCATIAQSKHYFVECMILNHLFKKNVYAPLFTCKNTDSHLEQSHTSFHPDSCSSHIHTRIVNRTKVRQEFSEQIRLERQGCTNLRQIFHLKGHIDHVERSLYV